MVSPSFVVETCCLEPRRAAKQTQAREERKARKQGVVRRATKGEHTARSWSRRLACSYETLVNGGLRGLWHVFDLEGDEQIDVGQIETRTMPLGWWHCFAWGLTCRDVDEPRLLGLQAFRIGIMTAF